LNSNADRVALRKAAQAVLAAWAAALPALLHYQQLKMLPILARNDEVTELASLQQLLQPIDNYEASLSALKYYMNGTRRQFEAAFQQWLKDGTVSAHAHVAASASSIPVTTSSSSPTSSPSSTVSRLFWLKGSPGSGKTVISAMLCKKFTGQVR
jgi:Cdc6-like AAA superfamily ATPase